MFEREDWNLFRSLGTLPQKAGVPLSKLAALVLKEIADNALDAGANAQVSMEPDGWFVVSDDGPGLPGDGADIARLFSIRRPLSSSKLIRMPSRGALGNGLRVVAGAVLSSGGELQVETNGNVYELTPQDDGSTMHQVIGTSEHSGTKVRIRLGRSVEVTRSTMSWAKTAAVFSSMGKPHTLKQTSAWWYDAQAFFELLQAAGSRSAHEVLQFFREYKSSKPNMLFSRLASTLNRAEAESILVSLRNGASEPDIRVLGKVGDSLEGYSYANAAGFVTVGDETPARLPAQVEAYVKLRTEDDEPDFIQVLINRTPITGVVETHRIKGNKLALHGCGMSHLVDIGRKNAVIYVNVMIPYMPITTDGKEPDLLQILRPIHDAVVKAANRAKRVQKKLSGPALTQRQVILNHLDEAIDKASDDRKMIYSLRQLFYAVRPYMLEQLGKEPDYNYFAQVITDVEASNGFDLPGLYRDARGILYHPHTREEIPLGTLNVQRYERPEWTIRSVLYSEKEGLFSILKESGWPERNDCALLTSKGFASRAARDVLDLMGDTDEEIHFFCIHDADASGTLIYQALTEATKARGARRVKVINLGLEPWEALEMGLQVETFRNDDDSAGKKREPRRLPVANYVPREWENWLQTQRVELNAMTSPAFVKWLDSKMEPYRGKVRPPQQVLADKLDSELQSNVESLLAAQILNNAGFKEQVAKMMQQAREQGATLDLQQVVTDGLERQPKQRWDAPLASTAAELSRKLVG